MKNLLNYIYRTKTSGDQAVSFILNTAENIEITIEGKSMSIPFIEMVDMLYNAATELKDSNSPGTKRRALSLLAAAQLIPFFNAIK